MGLNALGHVACLSCLDKRVERQFILCWVKQARVRRLTIGETKYVERDGECNYILRDFVSLGNACGSASFYMEMELNKKG